MSETVEISRVVVIADTALEKILLSEFLSSVARATTAAIASARGVTLNLEDPMGAGRWIEVLTPPKWRWPFSTTSTRSNSAAIRWRLFWILSSRCARDNFY